MKQYNFIPDNCRPDNFKVTSINKGEYMGDTYSWSSNAKGWFKDTPTIAEHPEQAVKEADLTNDSHENTNPTHLFLAEENRRLKEENKTLVAALDMVARIFIYCQKNEFGVKDKIKATELAVKSLTAAGIMTIGETFEPKK